MNNADINEEFGCIIYVSYSNLELLRIQNLLFLLQEVYLVPAD